MIMRLPINFAPTAPQIPENSLSNSAEKGCSAQNAVEFYTQSD